MRGKLILIFFVVFVVTLVIAGCATPIRTIETIHPVGSEIQFKEPWGAGVKTVITIVHSEGELQVDSREINWHYILDSETEFGEVIKLFDSLMAVHLYIHESRLPKK